MSIIDTERLVIGFCYTQYMYIYIIYVYLKFSSLIYQMELLIEFNELSDKTINKTKGFIPTNGSTNKDNLAFMNE